MNLVGVMQKFWHVGWRSNLCYAIFLYDREWRPVKPKVPFENSLQSGMFENYVTWLNKFIIWFFFVKDLIQKITKTNIVSQNIGFIRFWTYKGNYRYLKHKIFFVGYFKVKILSIPYSSCKIDKHLLFALQISSSFWFIEYYEINFSSLAFFSLLHIPNK